MASFAADLNIPRWTATYQKLTDLCITLESNGKLQNII